MKRILFISVILLTGLLARGQTSTVPDGYQVFKYPNGTVSSEGVLKNGKPDGFWKSYYVTGVKKSEGKYTNFQLDSVWVFFDQAGDTWKKSIIFSESETATHSNMERMFRKDCLFSQRNYMPATERRIGLFLFSRRQNKADTCLQRR